MRHSVHLIITLLLAFYVGSAAHGQTSAANTIVVEQPWARATPGGAKTGAAYMTLINNGRSVDRLLGATTPLADKVQFHKETEDKGGSRMRAGQSTGTATRGKIILNPSHVDRSILGVNTPLTG